MFNFFRSKAASSQGFSNLGIDFHSHLLPGVDDGSPSLEVSIELLKGLNALGYHTIYTTPHVMSVLYPNSRDLILRKRDEVQEVVEQLGIPIRFDAAAEYMLDETFEALFKKEPLLTLPGNRVLIEMSTLQSYRGLESLLFDLQIKGYRPVMAHPERYSYLGSVEKVARLDELGCELQVNLLSLTGFYGKTAKEMARKLLEADLVSYLCTDLHNVQHLDKLKAAVNDPLVQKTIGKMKNARLEEGPEVDE
jgi:protein-tyrosine phosphatase